MGFYVPTGEGGIPHPGEVAAKLLKLPEHQHITEAEARIEWLMRGHAEVRAGRAILGTVYKPEVNGRLRDVFDWLIAEKFGEVPDFLIVLDGEFWKDATDHEREILVYHELCHITPSIDAMGATRFSKETGLMVLTLRSHDVEEFADVVRRYGAYSRDLEDFQRALEEGNARPA